ncbi:ComEA family DNA-binding protein [Cellulomonas persica]|uniref:Helix-hairpin-helix DNA-binding motif class 1 domain-containing protein n=1 Tax=Cellulomonas persica TaxID=76861 RepID=A0A510UT39_9CELL|nr:ComEA family DNA-binding protein [Cellulomonas persica]GEK17844.1 hypothetical protein CPE01_15770 [Cellulomonas persica]
MRARLAAVAATDESPSATVTARDEPFPADPRFDGGRAQPALRPATSAAGAPFGDALAVAASRYADAHGVLPGPEPARTRVRWRPSPRTALGAAAALALVAGGVALRAVATRPGEPVELPVPLPLVSTAAATSAPTGAQDVVVDVAGAVVRPGVVRLPAGSRVVDALTAAGGATDDADLTRLNLARLLVDAEQVLVARQGDPVTDSPAAAPAEPGDPQGASSATAGSGTRGDARVDLNAADPATLETLPGIGPVLAERIVARRQERPFASVDELLEVVGIGPKLLDQLRERVRV